MSSVPSEPAVRPGLLEEIVSELSAAGINPRPLSILHHALELGVPEDLAILVTQAAQRQFDEGSL